MAVPPLVRSKGVLVWIMCTKEVQQQNSFGLQEKYISHQHTSLFKRSTCMALKYEVNRALQWLQVSDCDETG
jgi:hypothetical protein